MPALDSVVEGELLTFMSSVHTQCVNAGDKNEETPDSAEPCVARSALGAAWGC